MIKFAPLFAACLLGSAGALLAQTPLPSQPVAPAAAPSPAAAALPADDLDTLRGHLNETVDVRGTPTGTGHSKSGTVAYLNFGPAHKAVAVVAFLGGGGAAAGGGTVTDPAVRKAQSEDDLKPFVGKAIIIHGKLADYKGDLQIVLDSLDQIKLAP